MPEQEERNALISTGEDAGIGYSGLSQGNPGHYSGYSGFGGICGYKTVKPPDPALRNSDVYTIVDKWGGVHKSTDKGKLFIEYCPPAAEDTLAELREGWVSSIGSYLSLKSLKTGSGSGPPNALESSEMDVSEAIKLKEELELIKVVVKLENQNAPKPMTDADIIVTYARILPRPIRWREPMLPGVLEVSEELAAKKHCGEEGDGSRFEDIL